MEAVIPTTTKVLPKCGVRARTTSRPFTPRAEQVLNERAVEADRELRSAAQRIAKGCYAESTSAEHVEMAYRQLRPGPRQGSAFINSIGGIMLSVAVGRAVVMFGSGVQPTIAGFVATFALATIGVCIMVVAFLRC
jgi:hypothetical protein